MKHRLQVISAIGAAVITALIVHGLTASSTLWYLRTMIVLMAATLVGGSIVALFRG